jgi:predicted enzyme related to lactoylglutathione lyase
VTSIEPELWVDRGAEAVTFYQAAFGATVLHRAGDGKDVVDQLAIGDAAFYGRLSRPAHPPQGDRRRDQPHPPHRR